VAIVSPQRKDSATADRSVLLHTSDSRCWALVAGKDKELVEDILPGQGRGIGSILLDSGTRLYDQ
jgi:hypothetical protein